MSAKRVKSLLILTVFSVAFAAPAVASAGKTVDCGAGQSLAKAVRHAPAGKTIYVKGFCDERIRIRRDRIKIVGVGHSGIDGSNLDQSDFEFNPLVRVRDAAGVVIRNMEMRNSPAEGLLVEGKASVVLKNVSARNNRNVGLLVDHARVVINEGTYEGNQAGIDTTNNASAVLRGDISLQGNGVFGIAASNGAAIEVRGANLQASGNQLAGLLLEGGSLSIFNFTVSQGSRIIADNNGLCGFVIVGGGFLDIVAPPPLQFQGGNLVSTSNNQACGFLVTNGSKIESPFGAATFQISGNPAGMLVSGNSDLIINGGLRIENNMESGLVADGAGVITLAPAVPSPPPALPSVIVNNGGPDVALTFGSRATFEANVSVGQLVCDGTALARGVATCP